MENPEEQLKRLLEAGEGEVVEFKEARTKFDFDELGRYFTALANEARLGDRNAAWLVFGVDDKRKVVGTDYRKRNSALENLKGDLYGEAGMTFRSITPFEVQGKRVILFDVPAVAEGQPLAWKGHYYGRAGDSLVALSLDKLDILRSGAARDWTAELVAGAGVEHIDEEALQAARDQFKLKHTSASEVKKWAVMEFLERVGLARNGRINRAGILLLGKPEAAGLLSPHPAQITWKLEGPEEDYHHFGPPFLTATSELYGRIRNMSIRILPVDSLLARVVSKYERSVLLEALHNCIAHQDYTRNARIRVVERAHEIRFISKGEFFDGKPWDYHTDNGKMPGYYRNNALVQAMHKLGMIDTIGRGIYRMYSQQAARWLPLPDYDVENPSEVSLTIHGKMIDEAFSRQLIEHTDLSLSMIVALDRVQKRLSVEDQAIRQLRRRKLIEGRKPNLYVSSTVAKQTSTEAEYIRKRGQDDAYYMKLIEDYLKEFGQATRQKINELLLDKLGEALGEDAKGGKIGRLLEQMRRQGKIVNRGTRAQPSWELVKH